MAEQFANNASTTLNGNINNSATSVVVTDASVFPSSGNFRILIGSEIILVTAVSSNTLTVTRGAESTTAATHNSGDNVDLVYTKGSIEQLIANYDQSGTYSSRPSSAYQGTFYTATDLDAKWWYDGTNWNLINPCYVPYSRRWIPGNWTAANQNGTYTDCNGILVITGNQENSNAIRGYTKAIPTAPYKCTWILDRNIYTTVSSGFYVGHRESSTGKCVVMYNDDNNSGIIGVESWTNFNAFASSYTSSILSYRSNRVQYARIYNDNTNWIYQTSFDGNNFSTIFSHAKNTGTTTAADQIFFGLFTVVDYKSGTAPAGNTPPGFLLGYWEE